MVLKSTNGTVVLRVVILIRLLISSYKLLRFLSKSALLASLPTLINEETVKPPLEVDIPSIDEFQGIHM